jgi:hypothetical protein
MEMKFWRPSKARPGGLKTLMPKATLIPQRREMLKKHQRQLRRDSVTLDDVRAAMDFARKQSAVMLTEFSRGLMVGEINASDDERLRCGWTLVGLVDGFRSMWRPVRRELRNQYRRNTNSM